MMANTATTAAAAAECHYQSGRYSQAAIEIQRCCEAEGSEDDVRVILPRHSGEGKSAEEGSSLSPSSLHCGKSGDDGIIDERDIILVNDDECDNANAGGGNDGFDTLPHRKTKSATEDENNNIRMELMALSSLAHRADLAMCQFRASLCKSESGDDDSAVAKSSNINHSNSTVTNISNEITNTPLEYLWKRAKQSNQEYRNALRGAAMSLVSTASTLQQSNQANQGRNDGQYLSIASAMKSTALAILMAGVAASHLYLYRGGDLGVDNVGLLNTTNNVNDNTAWKVLVNSAVLAADLMTARRKFMDDYYGTDNGENGASAEASKSSLLEESLGILNDTFFATANAKAVNNSNIVLENERCSMAMQSFRTALKVAALSCGKIILPTVRGGTDEAKSMQLQQPQRKRQKGNATAPTDDAKSNVWSVNYNTNSNPILRSRERLVDALSYHYAATKYSCDEAKLRNKRNICLEEGRMWEEQSSSGIFETDDQSGWCAGYAWKMKHCLEGLDFASSLSSPKSSSVQDLDTIRSLQKMALSSSKFACDLLGCIYAKQGEVARALEMFQSSLECASTIDSGDEFAQRGTIVNMTLCFLALGEANAPLELLLHLWTMLSRNDAPPGTRLQPVEMLLTSDSCQVGVNIAAKDVAVDHHRREQLLWMLFYASSLSQDWATCLSCAEEILKAPSFEREDNHTAISRAFALLQCRRPSTAQELIRNLTPTLIAEKNDAGNDSGKRLSAELLLVVSQLYNADAYLLQERSLNDKVGNTPFSSMQLANKSLMAIAPQIDASSSLLLELQILMANNHGVAQIIEGDSVGALGSFRRANQLLKSTLSNDPKGLQLLPWMLMPTFFNLSLILLRDGHLEESARTWLRTRNHLTCWEKSIRGDSAALKKLRDLHTVAINRHVILMAKRKMQPGAAVWDQENIMEWVPPSFETANDSEEESPLVGGVDASQVIAMDVILLRYAISFAERKAAASFRRSAGSIRY